MTEPSDTNEPKRRKHAAWLVIALVLGGVALYHLAFAGLFHWFAPGTDDPSLTHRHAAPHELWALLCGAPAIASFVWWRLPPGLGGR